MLKFESNWFNISESKLDDIIWYYNENGINFESCKTKSNQPVILNSSSNEQQVVSEDNCITFNLINFQPDKCNIRISCINDNILIKSIDIVCNAKYMEVFAKDIHSKMEEYKGTTCGETLLNDEIGYETNFDDSSVDHNKHINEINQIFNKISVKHSDDSSEKIVNFTKLCNENEEVISDNLIKSNISKSLNNEDMKNIIEDKIDEVIFAENSINSLFRNTTASKFNMLQYSFDVPVLSCSLQFIKLKESNFLSIHSIHITISQFKSTLNQANLKSNIPIDWISLISQIFFSKSQINLASTTFRNQPDITNVDKLNSLTVETCKNDQLIHNSSDLQSSNGCDYKNSDFLIKCKHDRNTHSKCNYCINEVNIGIRKFSDLSNSNIIVDNNKNCSNIETCSKKMNTSIYDYNCNLMKINSTYCNDKYTTNSALDCACKYITNSALDCVCKYNKKENKILENNLNDKPSNLESCENCRNILQQINLNLLNMENKILNKLELLISTSEERIVNRLNNMQQMITNIVELAKDVMDIQRMSSK